MTWGLEDGARVARERLSARGGPDRPFTDSENHAKIRGIMDEPGPGLVEARMEATDLTPDALARRWRETMAEPRPAVVPRPPDAAR